MAPKLKTAIGILLALALGLVLLRNYGVHGRDFEVFWNAGSHLIQGEPIYSVERDVERVFKYPPWIVPFFVPFGLFPLSISKVLWGLLQVASLFGAIFWCSKRIRSHACLIAVVAAFWGLWLVHAMDGQISLLMLFLALLWGGEKRLHPGLVTLLSAKIFTVFPLIETFRHWKFKTHTRNLLITAAIWMGLTTVVALAQSEFPWSTFVKWVETAQSGGAFLGWDGVRGHYNPSLTALVLRTLDVPANQTHLDILTFLVLGGSLGAIWYKWAAKLPYDLRWAGWIALTPVVHPLPYWYSFVMAFPLCVLTLDRSIQTRGKWAIVASIFGILMVTAMTRKTLGHFGERLELLSIKSIGILVLLGTALRMHIFKTHSRG